MFADVPARPARPRARGLLHRGHRRGRVRPGARHTVAGPFVRHQLHPPGARAVRPGRQMVVRQLRRHLPRPGAPTTVRRFCADADLFINLSGGSWFWRDEYARIPRSAFIDSDPAFTQLSLAKNEPWYVDFFTRFTHLFTFGSNIGTPACDVPVGAFHWHKTWQPVTLDDWAHDSRADRSFLDGDDLEDRELHRRRRQQGSGVRQVHRPARPGRRSISSWR